jgi:cobalt/nickel transport system permease protein
MHIPDGYLSPSTCAALYVAAAPFWVTAGRRVRKVVRNRYVPLVAIGAAYSFLIMMFNVPIPNGTTAHAVGASVVAIVLGPWAAVIAVSTALLIQALFFGDGGLLAYGANAFNMAIAMPIVGYAVYRALSRHAPLTSRRRAVSGAIAGYVGLNTAALLAAIEFGIQPALFKTADGTPLYAPFNLSHTIPAMLFAHLLVAGVVEGVVTAGIITYLRRANLPVMRINHASAPGLPALNAQAEKAGSAKGSSANAPGRASAPDRRPAWRWAAIGLGIMVVLSPVGLLAPGGAFGEDAPANLDIAKYGLKTIPQGVSRYYSFWQHSLLSGYGFRSGDQPLLGYILSAVVGIGAIALGTFAVWALFHRIRRPNHQPRRVEG